MNSWRPFFLIACVLLSGCTLRTGSRTDTSPALVSSGPSLTYSTPRNSVPSIHRQEARQIPVTRIKHAAFLSPRMHGFYFANRAFERPGASASKAEINQPGSREGKGGDNKTIIAQSLGSRTFEQISNQQVAAASLFPPVGPLIVIVIICAALIYAALYKIAGSIQQAVRAIPLEDNNKLPEDAQTAGAGADKSNDAKLSCSDRRRRILQGIQSRIKRTDN